MRKPVWQSAASRKAESIARMRFASPPMGTNVIMLSGTCSGYFFDLDMRSNERIAPVSGSKVAHTGDFLSVSIAGSMP